MIKYIGFDGQPITEAEFHAIFGAFEIIPNEEAQFHVVRLKAVTDSNVFRLRVVDPNWKGVQGVDVVFGWPDGFSTAQTGVGGWAEFGMFKDAWYEPPGAGPHDAHIDEPNGERITGIGMIAGTHYTHFDAVLQQGAEPPPPPDEVTALLYAALDANEEVRSHIHTALDLLEGDGEKVKADKQRIEEILGQALRFHYGDDE